ncbi:unnamed protein product, partial [Arabidopsis halleri]
ICLHFTSFYHAFTSHLVKFLPCFIPVTLSLHHLSHFEHLGSFYIYVAYILAFWRCIRCF